MIGASSKAKSCRNLVGTASSPAALCTVRPFSSLYTPFLPTWMLFMFGWDCPLWMAYLKDPLLYRPSGTGYLGFLPWTMCHYEAVH